MQEKLKAVNVKTLQQILDLDDSAQDLSKYRDMWAQHSLLRVQQLPIRYMPCRRPLLSAASCMIRQH